MQTRIESIGNERFVDYKVAPPSWKNFGVSKSYDDALRLQTELRQAISDGRINPDGKQQQ